MEGDRMTEEKAKKIIKRKEGIMTAALILMGVGCLMFLLGESDIIFPQIGGILFLTGSCVGIIARENKKYKAANEYMEQKIRNEKAKQIAEQKATIKCSECLRPIVGYVWHLNNKAYCRECYNRNMAIIQQNGGGEPEECDFETTSEVATPRSKMFVCNVCGKSLPTKYLHSGSTCAECHTRYHASKSQSDKDKRKPILPLGSFDFTEDDREKLKDVAIRYMPSTLTTVEAQLSLLRTLSFVMEISSVELKTAILWKIPNEMPDEEKEKRFKFALGETILAVDQIISFQICNPNLLMKKVNSASAEDLLKSWIVLDYYAYELKQKYTPNIQYFRDYIHNVIQTKFANPSNTNAVSPIKVDGTNIYFDSNAFFQWKEANVLELQYELKEAILLNANPTIYLYEDGVKTREYVLQTEGDEDFSEKYFRISIRLGMWGNPSAPVAQIDGFISDTPEEREMTLDDIGYRFEGHYLKCGGEISKQYYEKQRGQDLEAKGLKYPGYTTPSNVRLIGVCPECGKSFAFHGYAFYMRQSDVAYSDDGLDCCEIQTYNIDKATWAVEIDGKTFRYYNSFNCPHCGTPYINYKKYPANKVFGVSGCVLLGRKALTVNQER